MDFKIKASVPIFPWSNHLFKQESLVIAIVQVLVVCCWIWLCITHVTQY